MLSASTIISRVNPVGPAASPAFLSNELKKLYNWVILPTAQEQAVELLSNPPVTLRICPKMLSSSFFLSIALAALTIPSVLACSDCYGPTDLVAHERVVRRIQPTAANASYGPSRPLEWGQINFLQTTDTHGWLEGHIKEQNYGADWGDFVSFTRSMKQKAQRLGVDLLLVDTGITIIHCHTRVS
jgi:hypothetical protein